MLTRRMTMRPRSITAAVVVLGLAGSVGAATLLGPTRASDLFDLGTTFAPCPFSGGRVFDNITRAGEDGGASFGVPAGQVAVLTAVEVSAVWIGGTPAAAGRYVQIVLTRETAARAHQVGWVSGVFDTGESFSHAFVFPTGIALKPGEVLCATAFDAFAQTAAVIGSAHGFFVKGR